LGAGASRLIKRETRGEKTKSENCTSECQPILILEIYAMRVVDVSAY
jgi:hypothetical protein